MIICRRLLTPELRTVDSNQYPPSSKAPDTSNPLQRPHRASKPREPPCIYAQRSLYHFPMCVNPTSCHLHPISFLLALAFALRSVDHPPILTPPKFKTILTPPNPLHPFSDDHRIVDHDIHFLRMIPTLTILIPTPHNPDMPIDNHQFDMATPSFEAIMNRSLLIFGYIHKHLQISMILQLQVLVESVGKALVMTSLQGKHFAGVVVAETVDVCYFYAATTCTEDGGGQGLGVDVGGLDVDAFRGVAEGGEPGDVLRGVEGVEGGEGEGGAGDEGDGDG